MTLEIIKSNVIDSLKHAKDKRLLLFIEHLLKRERIRAYEASLKPMTKKQYLAEIEAAEKDFENGDFISIEELEKEMENW